MSKNTPCPVNDNRLKKQNEGNIEITLSSIIFIFDFYLLIFPALEL